MKAIYNNSKKKVKRKRKGSIQGKGKIINKKLNRRKRKKGKKDKSKKGNAEKKGKGNEKDNHKQKRSLFKGKRAKCPR